MHLLSTLAVGLTGLLTFTSGATFSNPLKDPNGSDPHIVYDGTYYFLMTTTWTDLQITKATTLEGLKTGETKVVWTDDNPTRCCSMWAPELQWMGDRWYIYYTAGEEASLDLQRPHALAGGTSPWDDFTYASDGSMTGDQWAIDATVLRMPDGNYFVYSCMTDVGQSLCIAPMTSATTLGASSVLSQPTEDWERVETPVQEGAAPMYHEGNVFLTYSGSYCWTDSYQLGLLTYDGSGDPALSSSWTKTGPVFSSANGNYGTGHNG